MVDVRLPFAIMKGEKRNDQEWNKQGKDSFSAILHLLESGWRSLSRHFLFEKDDKWKGLYEMYNRSQPLDSLSKSWIVPPILIIFPSNFLNIFNILSQILKNYEKGFMGKLELSPFLAGLPSFFPNGKRNNIMTYFGDHPQKQKRKHHQIIRKAFLIY